MQMLVAAPASALLILLVFAGLVSASSNVGPSGATGVKVGVPFTGVWKGTPYGHSYYPSHWWKLPGTIRPGDKVQLAVDNRLGKDESVNFCLVPPVDDFDASDAFGTCSEEDPGVGYGSQDRIELTYEGASGRAFLVAWLDDYCCLDAEETVGSGYGQYTATIERTVSLVNLGITIPPAIPASFSLFAYLTYGDNTPAANGIPAFLQWRFAPSRGVDSPPFENVVTAFSAGGVATFTGTMPAIAQGSTVQMRACVAQPGGTDVLCGPSGKTSVETSTCYRALASRRARTRAVRRTQRRLKRARARHAKRAKRRLKRSLKRKRRKLAKAKRSVRIHCA